MATSSGFTPLPNHDVIAGSADRPPNVDSPGLIDIQINGAYGFDFSVYEGDDQAYQNGLRNVAEKIVETGVTAFVVAVLIALFAILTDIFQSRPNLDRERDLQRLVTAVLI